MIKIATLLAAALINLLPSLPASDKLSGKTVTVPFSDGEFTQIDVSSVYDLEVTQGENYSVTVTVPEEYEEYLDVYVNHGILNLGFKKIRGSLSNMKDVVATVEVTMPQLETLNMSGSAVFHSNSKFTVAKGFFNLQMSGSSSVTALEVVSGDVKVKMSGSAKVSSIFDVDEIEFELSGFSKINSKVEAEELQIKTSGNSSAEVYGEVEELELTCSGTSSVTALELVASSVEAELSGTAGAKVNVTKRIEADLSGLSSLKYKCDGAIEINTKNISRGTTLKRIDD